MKKKLRETFKVAATDISIGLAGAAVTFAIAAAVGLSAPVLPIVVTCVSFSLLSES